jgi:hypothetical protein
MRHGTVLSRNRLTLDDLEHLSHLSHHDTEQLNACPARKEQLTAQTAVNLGQPIPVILVYKLKLGIPVLGSVLVNSCTRVLVNSCTRVLVNSCTRVLVNSWTRVLVYSWTRVPTRRRRCNRTTRATEAWSSSANTISSRVQVVGVARLHHAEHLAVEIRQTSETPVNKPRKAAVFQTKK